VYPPPDRVFPDIAATRRGSLTSISIVALSRALQAGRGRTARTAGVGSLIGDDTEVLPFRGSSRGEHYTNIGDDAEVILTGRSRDLPEGEHAPILETTRRSSLPTIHGVFPGASTHQYWGRRGGRPYRPFTGSSQGQARTSIGDDAEVVLTGRSGGLRGERDGSMNLRPGVLTTAGCLSRRVWTRLRPCPALSLTAKTS
jgi:hypothetical protein